MSQTSDKVKILGHSAIQAKLDRIAWQIYETNFDHDAIALAGIDERGGYLAAQLAARLNKIAGKEIRIVNIGKTGESGVEMNDAKGMDQVAGVPVVLIDDVLYSGVTIFRAVELLMEAKPTSIQTAILIDRGHRNIPIRPDYVGLDMATTLKQHVSFEIEGERVAAFIQ